MSVTIAISKDSEILLKVAEVARRLQLARSTVYMLVTSGELPAVKIGRGKGRAVRVVAAGLDKFVAARMLPSS